MSKKMSRYPNDCKVYVGELGNSARKNDLEDSFSYYGPLRNVWIARNPPGFAFVEFEDARDAEDAVRGLDGRTICGRRARVELSNGKSGRGFRGPPSRSRGRPFDPSDRCYECGDRGHYARDCRKQGRSRRRSHSRSRSRSRSHRTRSHTGSRSRSRSRRSRSRENSRDSRNGHDHSKSPQPRSVPRRSNSHGGSKTPKRSHSHSKSRSLSRNGGD
ncbi:serine/arginine-rich splicing factor 7 [Bradysia coprophila]|uniref:serine/arginine-rich splicing factor 7 n=1 Tax=Bradysia coprophila TaxID=38358 RepID=UPI00187DBC73|nr:serine/arginine-rich splicing factor 7 [Bradysia coprophila]